MLSLFLLFQGTASTKIAIGSCHGQFNQENSEIFYSIASKAPDLYIWLGDSIYADLLTYPNPLQLSNIPSWQSMYQTLKYSPAYTALRNATKITGTWDDHDFGQNDGDCSFPLKEISQKLFLDFIDASVDHEGLYRTYEIDPRIKLIILDVRYFRAPDEDVLGEKQWQWLQEELKHQRQIMFIATGLQVNVEDRYSFTERWDDKSRIRLLEMIEDVPGVVLLTGDIHFGELLANQCGKYPVIEITSSGLTHTEATIYGPIAYWYIAVSNAMSYHNSPRVLNRHFAVIDVNWELDLLHFEFFGSTGQSILSEDFKISFLKTQVSRKSSVCTQTPIERHLKHVFSCAIILHLPLLLFSISFIILIRKLSHTY